MKKNNYQFETDGPDKDHCNHCYNVKKKNSCVKVDVVGGPEKGRCNPNISAGFYLPFSYEYYLEIFKGHSTVMELGKDVDVFDWKSALANIQKGMQSLHFKITHCKRFILSGLKSDRRGVIVPGEPNYKNDIGLKRCITKLRKFTLDAIPQPLKAGVRVKGEKIKDVVNLLDKHYGPECVKKKELLYYKKVIEGNVELEDTDLQIYRFNRSQ